ncbi:MAG: 16S rRNA (cytosine(1402)-N(4))-methyltransferase RsmH [Bacillota bacterium]
MYHQPIMVREVLELLRPAPGGTYLDCTLGGGGHASAVGRAAGGRATVIGIDRDPEALAESGRRLTAEGVSHRLFHANNADLDQVLAEAGVERIDGVIFDLGTSSHQLDEAERGFSYQQDAPLDMRMDPGRGRTAADLVNQLGEAELARIIWEYGEERWSKRIAHFIINERERAPITTTGRLVEVIKSAIPAAAREKGPHPAKRTFQALRIAVNDELNKIAPALQKAVDHLAPGGRIAVITFHSLEDRIVKNTFLDLAGRCQCPPQLPECRCNPLRLVKVLTRKPLVPEEDELARNPRARSAKLRAAERLS